MLGTACSAIKLDNYRVTCNQNPQTLSSSGQSVIKRLFVLCSAALPALCTYPWTVVSRWGSHLIKDLGHVRHFRPWLWPFKGPRQGRWSITRCPHQTKPLFWSPWIKDMFSNCSSPFQCLALHAMSSSSDSDIAKLSKWSLSVKSWLSATLSSGETCCAISSLSLTYLGPARAGMQEAFPNFPIHSIQPAGDSGHHLCAVCTHTLLIAHHLGQTNFWTGNLQLQM